MKPVPFKRLTPGDFFQIGNSVFMKSTEASKAVVIISRELDLGQSVSINPTLHVKLRTFTLQPLQSHEAAA